MKNLYDENDRHLPEAFDLMEIARKQGIEHAFKWAHTNGFSIRQASHVIAGTVLEVELSTMLRPTRDPR